MPSYLGLYWLPMSQKEDTRLKGKSVGCSFGGAQPHYCVSHVVAHSIQLVLNRLFLVFFRESSQT